MKPFKLDNSKLSAVICSKMASGIRSYAGAGWKAISEGRDFILLHKYALKCDSVTEFGTFDWNGTWAFIDSDIKKLRCYDIRDFTSGHEGYPLRKHGTYDDVQKACAENEIDFQFILEDTSECVIEETDMLFVASTHTDTQVRAELKNADKVRKYILLHDCGGVQAIDEFLQENEDAWEVVEHDKNGMGMMVIGRKDLTF